MHQARFERDALKHNWRHALATSAITGIVISQASAWDRLFGAIIDEIFVYADECVGTLAIRAIVSTSLGLFLVLIIHKAANANPSKDDVQQP